SSQIIMEDARNFLRGSREKFDVIIGDLVVPWRPGEGGLYTLEHFATAKKSLNDNGLFCVWIPMFQIGETEFKVILRTFLSEFGMAFAWRADFSPVEPALALIAFKDGHAIVDSKSVATRLSQK